MSLLDINQELVNVTCSAVKFGPVTRAVPKGTTLKELSELEADMQMTVFIGSSATVRIQDRMVTPRGYLRISGT